MAYHSKFTGKQVDDILDSVSGKQDQLSEANQVEKGWIAERAVEGKNVVVNAITASKIAVNAITTSKIKDQNVTTEKIKPLAITNALIAESAISASRIANNAVQFQKLSVRVQNQLTTTIILSTKDIANWSGTETQFVTTFDHFLTKIINTANTSNTRVEFTYQGDRYTAVACSLSHGVTKSVAFLIHNPEGLTELISMNLDDDNVTITNETLEGGSEMSSGFYVMPTPDFSNMSAGGEVNGWTDATFVIAESAVNSGAKLICDMSDYMSNSCYAPAILGAKTGNTQNIHVSALASYVGEDGVIELNALELEAQHDYTTGKTTIVEVWNSTQSVGDESADPSSMYLVLESGESNDGFDLNSNPTTFTDLEFEEQFGFPFVSFSMTASRPLLLITKVETGITYTMTPLACTFGEKIQEVYFLCDRSIYYCKSSNGGDTIKVGHKEVAFLSDVQ